MSIGPLGRSDITFRTGSTVMGNVRHIDFRTGSTIIGHRPSGPGLGPGIPPHIQGHPSHATYHRPPSQRGPVPGIDTRPGGGFHPGRPGWPNGPHFGGGGNPGHRGGAPGFHPVGPSWFNDPQRRFREDNERFRREQEAARIRRERAQLLAPKPWTPGFGPRPGQGFGQPGGGFWRTLFGRRGPTPPPHPAPPIPPAPAAPSLVQQVKVGGKNVRQAAILGNNPDVTALLQQALIDGSYHTVATAKAKDGTNWQWSLVIDIDVPPFLNTTINEGVFTLKGGIKERRLHIQVSTKDAAAQTSSAAETAAGKHLFHEAIHANLLIDTDRVALGLRPTTTLFATLQQQLGAATQVGPERTALAQSIGAILAASGSATPASNQQRTNGAIEFLVTERFAARTTAAALGGAPSNAMIGQAYATEVLNRLPGHNTYAGALIGRNLPTLVTNFFNALDRHP